MIKRTKRAITLLEIMIVIFIIGIIGSVIGYNMRGSLEKGKVFKTEQGIKMIYNVLELQLAQGVSPDDVANNPSQFLENSGVVQNVDRLLRDGWGNTYTVTVPMDPIPHVEVISDDYENYCTRTGKAREYPWAPAENSNANSNSNANAPSN